MRELLRFLRRSPEASLCAVLLALTGIATLPPVWRATGSGHARDDLSQETLVQEIEGVVRPATGGRILELTAAEYASPWGAAHFDTVTIIDTLRLPPSGGPFGFLGATIGRFNRQQRIHAYREIAPRSRTSQLSRFPSGLLVAGPVRDAGGTRDLMVERTALTVPSPFAEQTWRTVLASDSRQRPVLLRAAGILDPVVWEERPRPSVRARGFCAALWRPALDATDVYCMDYVGAENQRNMELRIDGFPWPSGGVGASVSRMGQQRAVWRNGDSLTQDGESVRAGDLIYSDEPGGLIPADAVGGLLAGSVTINGRRRYLITDGPLRSMVLGLAQPPGGGAAADTLILTIHSALSRAIDSALAEYLVRREAVSRVEVVALDSWTGGVRLLAGRHFHGPLDYTPGFFPMLLGSTVKPILTTAILAEQPDLSTLQVQSAPGEIVTTLSGLTFRGFDAGAAGNFGLRSFLAHSSNKYAAALVARSLADAGGGRIPLDAYGEVDINALETSPLASGLDSIFGLPPGDNRYEGREGRLWRGTGGTGTLPSGVSRRLWPFQSKPFLFRYRESGLGAEDSLRGAPAATLMAFSYGQAWHEWTLLGIAEAFARVVTGRSVSARMLRGDEADTSTTFAWRNTDWANQVRLGLADVPVTGTGRTLGPAVRDHLAPYITIFAKTGTAHRDQQDVRRNRSGRNSLLMFLGPATTQRSAPDCGLAVSLAVDYVGGRPEGAEDHLQVTREVILPLVDRYWEALVTCRGGPIPPRPRREGAR